MINKIDKETRYVDGWHEITDFRNGVIAIGEPNHQEEVFSYLIKGEDRDLLIDTGMGIAPITNALEQIRNSDKELIVVNSHWHFDHIGGNTHFDKVLVPRNEHEVKGILNGWSNDNLRKYDFFDQFSLGGRSTLPDDVDAETFAIPGFDRVDPVLVDGYKIDLGGKVVRVIETPGHTKGSVSFFEETDGLLFPADLLYEGPLYAFDSTESDPDEYLSSLKKIKRELGRDIVLIHPGHNYADNCEQPFLLKNTIDLFEMAKDQYTPDAEMDDFGGVAVYKQPGMSDSPGGYGHRRLSVLVSKNYIKRKT